MHFGEITFGVDERGEVGLLTRNIRIEASDDAETSYFGGHIMAMAGSHMYVDGVELSLTQDALEAIAQQARRRKTGARGLRTSIEEVLLEVMYEIPSMKNVRKCVVNADVINNRTRPLLMTVNDRPVEVQASA